MSADASTTPALPSLATYRPSPCPPIIAILDKQRILAELGSATAKSPSCTTPVYNARDFGARGDGRAIDTRAIQAAVDAAHTAGGGVAYVPPGVYMTGGVELKSRVTLYLEAGAYLWGAEKQADYVHPRGHLVFGFGIENAALRGRGTIYGNAEAIMDFPPVGEWCSDRRIPKNTRVDASCDPKSPDWRPERCLYFDQCTDLVLEGVTVRHTPEWAVHLHRSSRVRVTGLSIINGLTSRVDKVANGDGLDIDTCSQVFVSDCFVQSSDDSICLKIEEYGEKTPSLCRDITVTNCVTRTTQTAIKLGTGSYGEYRNVVISNCTVMDGAGGIGMWTRDGGIIDGVRIDNITISQESDAQHGTAFYFRGYRRGKDTPRDGLIRNVSISNVTATCHAALFMAGADCGTFENITFDNIHFILHGTVARHCAVTPPVPFHAYAMNDTPFELYVHHARTLRFHQIRFDWDALANPAWRQAMRLIDVDGLTVDGFSGRAGGAECETILLHDVKNAWVRNSLAEAGTKTFLHLQGACGNIYLSGNDLSRATTAVTRADEVPASAVTMEGNRLLM